MGFCAIALDIGLLEMKRLQMQDAADAAAMGALLESERGNTDWVSAGIADAALNGFVNGSGNVTVTITNPPTTGSYTTDQGAFQAKVTQSINTLFTGQVMTMNAQATAHMPPCGYFLNTSGSYNTLSLASSTLVASCPVYDAQGMYVDASSTATADDFLLQGATGLSTLVGTVTPTPIYSYPAMSDPLSTITSPSFSMPCNFLNLSLGLLNTHTIISTPLNPGVYCGGMTLLWSTVTLNPGLYIIVGGLDWVSSTVNGTGVTLFMTKGSVFSYGQVIITGNPLVILGGPSVVNLSAPTDSSNGGIPGVLLFGDRNWVKTTADDIQLTNCSFNGDGIIYFIRTGIYASACPIAAPHYFGMVVDNLQEISGSVHLSSNYSSVVGGNPFHPRESLAE
jgi:hypothetical protein